MAGGGDDSERKLYQTPSWAVAGICAAIVLVSLILENILHKGHWLKKKNKKEMMEALEKIKAELMILGFISLIFTFTQSYFAKICIPVMVADTMHPCSAKEVAEAVAAEAAAAASPNAHRRRLLAAPSGEKCGKGKIQLISANGVHQLHVLIFYLAIFHVLYSAATMMLGKMKIRRWKAWEPDTSYHDYSNDPSRFRLTHETSFVRTHATFWTRIRLFFYVGCFFRHIFQSVRKSDFVTLRNGFIATHLSARAAFNFQKYIMRSLEDDFRVVVGVSYVLWGSFVVFLLLNVHGWNTLLWTSALPLIIILAVGTKLQAILTSMAVEISERHAVVQGIPRVQCSDDYFWFSRPRFLLHLLHFSLFQNAFQITYLLWIWYEFGLHSCFHEKLPRIIAKIILGFFTIYICSYITLPLYALVTQMGSQMKKSVFDEQTSKALKKWQMGVKNKQGGDTNRDAGKPSSTITLGKTSNSMSMKTTNHSPYMEDNDNYNHDFDDSSSPQQTSSISVRVEHQQVEAEMTQIPSRTHN